MLSAFEHELGVVERRGPDDAEVRSATGDSRQVRPGTMFAAIPGTRVDGHRFIPQAHAGGASVVLLRDWPDAASWPEEVVALRVEDPRRALALAANALCGYPTASMATFGITGTNGKTSTVGILSAILREAGHATGTVGTTGIEWDAEAGRSESHVATHTTPDGPALYGWLGRMRDDGVSAVALELSSHALDQGRAAGVSLDVAAWSNLSRDHLDYHGTLEAYEAAKALMFSEQLTRWGKPGSVAVLNIDDPAVARHNDDHDRVWTVSARVDSAADVHPDLEPLFSIDGCHTRLTTPVGQVPLASRLIGRHNLDNSLMAAAMALAAGVDPVVVARGLGEARGAPGRLERVELSSGHGPSVFVDYAHTPDAIDGVLAAVRPLCSGRVVVVLGCGGDRDAGKRPAMGTAAAAADRVVLTSDNPRTEDPEAILDAIEFALAPTGTPYLRCPDRAEAIRTAILEADPTDVVLVLGKGHETTQDLGDRTIPFDDREHAAAALREW